MNTDTEPTLEDVLAAIAESSTAVENRLTGVEGQLTKIEKRLTSVEANMVTKTYLDDKLADKNADAGKVIKAEDEKLNTLVHTLHDKKVLTDDEHKKILALKPFPQLV